MIPLIDVGWVWTSQAGAPSTFGRVAFALGPSSPGVRSGPRSPGFTLGPRSPTATVLGPASPGSSDGPQE